MKKKQYKIGVELECFIDYDSHGYFLESIQGLPFEVGSDGSIAVSGNDRGMEIRARGGLSYTKLTRSIKKLSELCSQHNVAVNKSCGFHVHMSNKRFFNARTIKKLVLTWVAIEDVLLATQPRSRFNNQYCKRYLIQYINDDKNKRAMPQGKEALITELSRNDRYYTLNLSALEAHGTIEVRLHSGTVDSKKVIAWINMLMAIYDYVLTSYDHKTVTELFEMSISDEKIAKVFDLLQLDKQTRGHFDKRISKFLFNSLARQQQSANKLIGMNKAVKKAQELYYKSRDSFEDINRNYEREADILRASA